MDGLLARAVGQVTGAGGRGLDLALDGGASALAAADWAQVSRALLRYADGVLGRAWAAGWRPADLARAVRRELAAVHGALAADLVAAEGRRYPDAGLDRRWREQLRELSAEVWWSTDDAYLAEFAARHRLDRFTLATAVLELLRMCGLLPPIAPVGPAPGRSVPGPVTGEPKQLSRIRALLAKAESTEYPQEAEALSAKAQQLMARHSIDTALPAAGRPAPDSPGALRIGIDNPYQDAKAMLLDAVAAANRCRAVWDEQLGFCTVVGFDTELDAVELLYTSLLVQATTAMGREGGRRHRAGAARTKDFRQSFLIAYAARVRERLAAASAEAVSEAGDGERLLPVLAARVAEVDSTVDRLFPRLTAQRVRIRDGDGWAAGQAAADRAALHGRSLER